MLAPCLLRRAILTVPLVFVVALLVSEPGRADQEAGTAIPAESMYHPAVPAALLVLQDSQVCPNNSNSSGYVLPTVF